MAFDNTSQLYGRRLLRTNRVLTGDPAADIEIVAKILEEVISIHNLNVTEEEKLFKIYLNDSSSWTKTKETRADINNVISIPTAWALSRTLNGYCFAEPIKYIARGGNSEIENGQSKQALVEKLSTMLDYANNHDSTVMATLSASICGLGYKLCLPSSAEELEESGVPFVINDKFIFPQFAGVVVSDEAISRDVLGFIISDYYNPDTNEKDGVQYTCWTKYAQYVFKEGEGDVPYQIVKQKLNIGSEQEVDFVPLTTNRIPLVEVERNSMRKGDWEVATDLIAFRNNLISNRADDIQQIIDYVMVLMNCKFETEDDKNKALKGRLLTLKATDPQNKPSVDILKNQLDQTGVQTLVDCLDLIIQECIGVPNRQERGGGGGDTGQAVKYRNGFRDLENNAGIIIPKMDKAETKLLALCVAYCKNSSETKEFNALKASDIRCKFMRTLNDDIVSSSQAFRNYYEMGVSMTDSLILAKAGTDPSEISANATKAYENGETYNQRVKSTTSISNKNDSVENEQGITAEKANI